MRNPVDPVGPGADDGIGEELRYRAPALEKGLDILELVAAELRPMTVAEIVRRLERSTGELFRMIQVLEHRGYLARSEGGEGFRLTEKLFALGMSQPQVKGLVELALPHMRALAQACGQSCHLAMHSQGQIVVVARMESSEELGFSVRVGYRRGLTTTCSGAVLYAFQSEPTRQRWASHFDASVSADELEQFNRLILKATKQGYLAAPSQFVVGVTDLSAPVLRGDVAAAALAIPFVKSTSLRQSMDDCLALLRERAAELSAQLVVSDARL